MGILKYSERVHGMFEMTKLLHPLSRKNKEYHKAACYISVMPFKKYIICKEINDSIPKEIQ